jgi:dipeptidase
MSRRFFLFSLFFTQVLSDEIITDNDKCTTIIVGSKAGSEGPMTTHTADCSDCDFRISKVPAMDWEEGTKRPLYLYQGPYPSTVSPNRGDTWLPSNLEGTPDQKEAWGTETQVTGYIPQVGKKRKK